MNIFYYKGLKNTFIFVLSLTLLYLLVICAYPFIWGGYLNKTEPPKKNGELVLGSNLNSLKPLEVAVIGDSTAAGQGGEVIENSFSYQYLQTFLAKNQQIKYNNFAVSGSKIKDVLENQIEKIPTSVELIFVSIGANDVTAFTSPSIFEAKVKELTEKLKSFSNARVIWMSIPDFITVPILLPPLNYVFSKNAKEFNFLIKASTNEKNFIYVDVFDSTRNDFANNPNKNFDKDKYHPSKDGYKLWSESINSTISNLYLN